MMQSWMINLYSVDDACKFPFLKKVLEIHFLLKHWSPVSVMRWCERDATSVIVAAELHYFDGLVQDCSNSIANALELCSLALSHRLLLEHG